MRHLRLFCCAALGFSLAAPLAAQQPAASSPARTTTASPADGEETIMLEEFPVTGTNLRRTDLEKVLPVSTVDTTDIEARGVNTMIELLEYIPQINVLPELGEGQPLTGGARGDLATVSLRGLSSGNTLLLINGRRLAPFPVAGSESQTPALITNANQIPTAAIERVEVLRDGASAIYGSDATAGVVNTILRRNYTGIEVGARYGEAEGGVLKETKFTAAAGRQFNSDRTSLSVIYDYFKRTPLFARDREYSRSDDLRRLAPFPWNGAISNENDFDNRSAQTEFGQFRRGTVGAGFAVTNPSPRPGAVSTQLATNGTFFIVPTATGLAVQPAQPGRVPGSPENEWFFDVNAYRFATPKTERHNLYSVLEHAFSDNLTVYGELGYYVAETTLSREPSTINNTADNFLVAPANNPYNPFGDRFFHPTGANNADGTPRLTGTPSDVILIDIRKLEFGVRPSRIESDALRLVGGARGKIFDSWRWDASGLFAVNTTKDEEGNNIRESKLRQALNRSDSTAFNPFPTTFSVQGNALVVGPTFTNPESVVAPLREAWRREGESTLTTATLSASGDVLELRPGPISVATGYEWRHETYDFELAPFAGRNPAGTPVGGDFSPISGDNDFIAISPSDDTHAKRDVHAVYLESNIPLIGKKQGVPFAQSFEMVLAARSEFYSDFGDATKPKLGFNYRLNRWFGARWSYNEGFRAPNLAQLFSGALQRTNVGSSDPYRGPVTSLISDTSGAIKNLRTGNDQLKPEETESINFGVVVEVPWVKGLSFTADYYRIQQEDAIGILDFADQLSIDRDLLVAETQRQLAAGTPIANVNLEGRGNPNVTRFAVNADDITRFATYNATQPASGQRGTIGAINFVNAEYVNSAVRNLTGYDFAVEYRTPQWDIGRFTVKTEATYLKKNEVKDRPTDSGFSNRRWRDGNPLWRGTGTVRWQKDNLSLGVLARYVGSFLDTSAENNTQPAYSAEYISSQRFKVREWITYNLFGAYRFDEDFRALGGVFSDLTLRIGVNNVLGEDPPLADEQNAYNTSLHNARGRNWYVELTKRF